MTGACRLCGHDLRDTADVSRRTSNKWQEPDQWAEKFDADIATFKSKAEDVKVALRRAETWLEWLKTRVKRHQARVINKRLVQHDAWAERIVLRTQFKEIIKEFQRILAAAVKKMLRDQMNAWKEIRNTENEKVGEQPSAEEEYSDEESDEDELEDEDEDEGTDSEDEDEEEEDGEIDTDSDEDGEEETDSKEGEEMSIPPYGFPVAKWDNKNGPNDFEMVLEFGKSKQKVRDIAWAAIED